MKRNIFRQIISVMFCTVIALQTLQTSVFAADPRIKPTKDSSLEDILNYNNFGAFSEASPVDKEKNKSLFYEPAKKQLMDAISANIEQLGIYPKSVNQTYLHENPIGNNSAFEFTKLVDNEFDPVMMGPLYFWKGGTIKYTKAEKEDYPNHYLVLYNWGGGGRPNEIVAYTSKLGESLILDKPGIYTICAYDVSTSKNTIAENNFNYLDGAQQVYVFDFPDSVKAPESTNKSILSFTDHNLYSNSAKLLYKLENPTNAPDVNNFAIIIYMPPELASTRGSVPEIHFFKETVPANSAKTGVMSSQLRGDYFVQGQGFKLIKVNFKDDSEMYSFKQSVPMAPLFDTSITYLIDENDAGVKWFADNFKITIVKGR